LSKDGSSKLETVAKTITTEFQGVSLVNTSREERTKLGIKSGVKVEKIENGAFKAAGIPKGFVITHINNEPVYSAQGAVSVLEALKGSIVVEGILPGAGEKIYAVKLPKSESKSEE